MSTSSNFKTAITLGTMVTVLSAAVIIPMLVFVPKAPPAPVREYPAEFFGSASGMMAGCATAPSWTVWIAIPLTGSS